jgi:hypothetical protein
MKHFDEHTLDLFVLDSGLVQQEVRDEITRHIRQCSGCKGMVESMKSFYSSVSELIETNVSDVDLLLERLFPGPAILRLKPYKPAVSGEQENPGAHISVLAAKTPGIADTNRFQTVAVVASEHDHAVLRIQHDTVDGSYMLYFHTDESYPREGGIVSLPSLQLDLLLDHRGQASFVLDAAAAPADWSTMECSVRFPLSSARISLGEISHEEPMVTADPAGAFRIELQYSEDRLLFSVRPTGAAAGPTLLVIKGTPGETSMLPLTEGSGSMPTEFIPAEFVLRLYE